MPSINSANLKLRTVDQNTTIEVTYNAVFTPFDGFLETNGLIFRERIVVFGIDPPGTETGRGLHTFEPETINVPAAGGTIPRFRSLTVTRASLQEDAGNDADEIRCRIRIDPVGMPTRVEEFTDQEILLG
jgi:hypothetical protein